MHHFFDNISQLKPKQIKNMLAISYVLVYLFLLSLYHTGGVTMLFGILGVILSIGLFIALALYIFLSWIKKRNMQQPANPLVCLGCFLIMWLSVAIVAPYDKGIFVLMCLPMFVFFVISLIMTIVTKVRKKSGQNLQATHSQPTPGPAPVKSRQVSIHPLYQQDLDQLAGHMRDLEQREASVSVFLDTFFADSSISKSRYLNVIRNAKHVLEANYENALRAAGMFGSGTPTAERKEIMDRYVSDSADVMNKIDRVIDQLIKVQQSDVLSDNSTLDHLLDDLAATTNYYQHNTGL